MVYKQSKEEEPGEHCLACGNKLGYGRTDRKFCSEQCKNRWHNQLRARSWLRIQARVLRALDRNHGILAHLLEEGVSQVGRMELAAMGFNFEYVTSCHKAGRRNACTCYDIQYEVDATGIRNLARQQVRLPPSAPGDS